MHNIKYMHKWPPKGPKYHNLESKKIEEGYLFTDIDKLQHKFEVFMNSGFKEGEALDGLYQINCFAFIYFYFSLLCT